ncbi:hypothetical protein ILYODFUR_007840 [Ilyodon furcidens]|uniref:Uncharacterized protein n=1 Tax=Ilyodon furcidens TaxID=33524 RepID=A0ABV0SLX6_9TELE
MLSITTSPSMMIFNEAGLRCREDDGTAPSDSTRRIPMSILRNDHFKMKQKGSSWDSNLSELLTMRQKRLRDHYATLKSDSSACTVLLRTTTLLVEAHLIR